MAYIKQNFVNGSTLTAEQLNAIDAQIVQNETDISNLQREVENKQPKGNYLTEVPSGYAKSVNGVAADENGNVKLLQPNLMQDDPSKGDYVKGKEEFLAQAGAGSGQNVVLPDNLVYYDDTSKENEEETIPVNSASGTTFNIGVSDEGVPFVTDSSDNTVWDGAHTGGGDSGDESYVKTVNGVAPDEKGNVDTSTPTDDQVTAAVNTYLTEHPVSGMSLPVLVDDITLTEEAIEIPLDIALVGCFKAIIIVGIPATGFGSTQPYNLLSGSRGSHTTYAYTECYTDKPTTTVIHYDALTTDTGYFWFGKAITAVSIDNTDIAASSSTVIHSVAPRKVYANMKLMTQNYATFSFPVGTRVQTYRWG